MTSSEGPPPVVVVVGANGLVGSRVCAALVARGARVRALVRRSGTAPTVPGVEEHVGDFTDPASLGRLLDGVDAAVTTVHPMGSDRATQERVAVVGTPRFARAARDAGVPLLVHLSTCAVYRRGPETGDVDEHAPLVGDDERLYGVMKRDTDAALAAVEGLTRVLVRPPAVLGPGDTSVWNALNPAGMRDDEQHRHGVPAATFAWVHVEDLATLVADVATGRIPAGADPGRGPVADGCTAVDVAGGPATTRDYVGTVCRALGVEPSWDDEPAWTGQVIARRARGWGWTPEVGLAAALAELDRDVRRLRA